jgi:hypothetical protein
MFTSSSEESQTHTHQVGWIYMVCQDPAYLSRAGPRIEEQLAFEGESSHSLILEK